MKGLMAKLGIITLLIIVLLIPIKMVNSLATERQERRNTVLRQMANIWGKPQKIGGISLSTSTGVFLPASLEIVGNIKTELRKKGIFQIPFYTSELSIKAIFNNKAFAGKVNKVNIHISDSRAAEIKKISWGNMNVFNHRKKYNYSVISVSLPDKKHIKKNRKVFNIKLNISGLDKLYFSPTSEQMRISLKSNWKAPNFGGAYLPTKREINEKGFYALWNYKNKLDLYKQSDAVVLNMMKSMYKELSFGVSLFVPVDIYLQIDRAIKYAALFIFLTFLTFFIFEILSNIKIHPLQYLLVGSGLTIFYLLLLSLSEHVSFIFSYFIATIATVLMITLYSSKVLNNKKQSYVLSAILIMLYMFLFTLLQLEQYSLLLGSSSLFILLAVVMYVTRNIDWYKLTAVANSKFENLNISSNDQLKNNRKRINKP